ncbi:MAG: anti-sigma factor family protein [Dysgonomonas sp.]
MEKNNCQYSDNDIWNYYSNLLSRDEEAQMQEHILACSSCKKRLHHLRGISDFLDNETDDIDELPLRMPLSITKKKYPIKRYLFLASSAVAAVVLSLLIIFPQKEKTPKDTEHPVYNIDTPSYSDGDTTAIDSTGVALDLDTLRIL